MTQPSLIRRLLLGIGLPLAVVIAVIGAIAYAAARDEIGEVYDSQMITWANELWLIARDDPAGGGITADGHDLRLGAGDQAALDEYAKWRGFRVWRDGRVVLASDAGASDKPMARGFSTAGGADGWRVFTLAVPDGHTVVEVRERMAARYEVVRRVVWGLVIPLLLALPVVALVVWRGGRWGLRDLDRFAAGIQRRSPDDLSRLDAGAAPREIAPLAQAINQLLGKLDLSRQQERLFTDNAAHELRTPLAAVAVQAEVVASAGEAERAAALDALSKGVTRASRLLDQLLVLARVRQVPVAAQTVRLHDVAAEAIRDIYPSARAKDIAVALTGDEGAVVESKAPLLLILLRNLLDNAVKYAPPGSQVEVALAASGLTVTDRGPGIPEAEREPVFQAFYRIEGTAAPGSGLGLAIVRTIADSLGAEITLLDAPGGGLSVWLRFTAATMPRFDHNSLR